MRQRVSRPGLLAFVALLCTLSAALEQPSQFASKSLGDHRVNLKQATTFPIMAGPRSAELFAIVLNYGLEVSEREIPVARVASGCRLRAAIFMDPQTLEDLSVDESVYALSPPPHTLYLRSSSRPWLLGNRWESVFPAC